MRNLLYVNNLYSAGQMVEQALKPYIAITDRTRMKIMETNF